MSAVPLDTTRLCLGDAIDVNDAPSWINDIDNPYLHGVYAPSIHSQLHEPELEVEGQIPLDIEGAYFRNGPNPQFSPRNSYHPFDGDGQLLGVYFKDGKAWLKSQLIATAGLAREQQVGQSLYNGVMGPFDFSLPDFPIKDTANTDVIWHNGQLVTLWYNAGVPYAMDPNTLENKGPLDFESHFSCRMSAHSRVDWNTGEMLFFDYGDEPPYMTYGVLDSCGKLVHEAAIDLPGPRLPHEMNFTTRFAVFHDHPFFHDVNVLRQHNMRVVRFHRDIPTRFGLMPRRGNKVTWFEFEPCYVLHTSNAWEEGDWVVIDGCRSHNPMPNAVSEEGALAHMLAYMRLEANNYRWRMNIKTGEVREGPIDDLNTEFNKSNQLFHGVRTRYAYHQYIPLREDGGHTLQFKALVKYDNDTGQYQRWDYGLGVFGSEAPYIPKKGATRQSNEDDGYVATIVTDSHDWSSACLIFDAKDITKGPIAKIKLPYRIPFGFHANWVRGEDLWGGKV